MKNALRLFLASAGLTLSATGLFAQASTVATVSSTLTNSRVVTTSTGAVVFLATTATATAPAVGASTAPVTPINGTVPPTVVSTIVAVVNAAGGAGTGQVPIVSPGSGSTVTVPVVPPVRVTPGSSATTPAATDLLQDFQNAAQTAVAARQDCIEKLKTATGADRAKLLEQLRQQEQNLTDQQRATARQIREQLKLLRDQVKSGG